MYVLRNNEARSCNHCCHGKVIRIKYSELVFGVSVMLCSDGIRLQGHITKNTPVAELSMFGNAFAWLVGWEESMFW